MKPFRYTLQPVLILRQRQENEALEACAKRLLARQRALDGLNAVDQQLEALSIHRRLVLADRCLAGELESLRGYSVRLEEIRVAANHAVIGAERELALSMREMLAARQKREAMDKHRGHLRANYDRSLSAEETKLLDDMAGRSFRARTISQAEPTP